MRIVSLFSVILLLGMAGGTRPGECRGQGRTAYTAKTVEKRFSPAGAETDTEFITEAVKSDGSQVKIVRKIAATKQWVDAKTILDVKARQRVELEPLTQSRTTSPLSTRYAQYLSAKPQSCGESAISEKTRIHGLEVLKVQNDYTLPSGEIDRVERWVAPVLDCFPLRERFSKGPKAGPFTLKMTRDVTSITRGEPNPSLFLPASQFKERSASEVAEEFKRKYPKLAEEGCTPCTTNLDPEGGH